MPNGKHDWVVAAIALIGSVAINVVLYAYAQGKQEHRIETLEKDRAEQREEWKTARERIEKTVDKLEEAIANIKH